MTSRKRKAQLPPWLQGVTFKKGVLVRSVQASDTETNPDNASKDYQIKDGLKHCTNKKDPDKDKLLYGAGSNSSSDANCKSLGLAVGHTLDSCKKEGTSKLLDNEQTWTAEKAVAMSYDEFCFEGTIIYSHNMDDCNLLCDDFISSIAADTEVVIGFDSEWPVTYQKGKQAKTALIQVCSSTDKCYLFHVSCMPKFPVMLKTLIEMPNVKKVGMNVECDIWKLDKDFDVKARDIIKNSMIELRTLANKKLRSAENWSLEGLAKNVLHRRISKDADIRKCDWSQFPLPELQQRYAATDAIVSLMLYRKLTKNRLVGSELLIN